MSVLILREITLNVGNSAEDILLHICITEKFVRLLKIYLFLLFVF